MASRSTLALLAVFLCSLLVHAGSAAAQAAPSAAHDHDHDHEHTAVAAAPGADHSHEHADEQHAAVLEASGTATAPVPEDHHEHEGDAHDHSSGHEGHAHGVDIFSFAETAVELGSVEAAKAEVCAQEALEDYNLGLHIGSVFILLAVSAGGALLPVALHISIKSGAVLTAVKMGTYFGFGTILSTAFIHMLLPAAQNLSSPCLPRSWLDAYEAWAYLFVVISIVLMQLIDYVIEGAYQRFIDRRGSQPHVPACHELAHGGDKHTHHAAVVGAIVSMHSSQARMAAPEPAKEPPSPNAEAAAEAGHVHAHGVEDGGACAVHGEGCSTLIAHKQDPSQIVGIYLMETGIIFHSVLIGITLGVTGGAAFDTLLVALAFHQFFEGFAIGSAVVDSGLSARRATVLGLAYAITTPIGIAIGIGMRESFNQNSTTTLMVEGIFDSVSTGILIYVVLVELINPLMTQSAWLRSRRTWVQALAFASFWAGVTVMAVIGKWV